MADKVIKSISQVTLDWLTTVLLQSGALEKGAVDGFEIIATQERELSSNVSLQLTYNAGSSGELPERLFLKMVNMQYDDDDPLLSSEVDYYTRDYQGVNGVPIPRCYHAALSEDLQRYHILLDDLSQTHIGASKKSFTLEHGLALAEGLAVMHAHWWSADRLRQGGKAIPSPEAIERFIGIAHPGAEFILKHYSDELTPHWSGMIREIYERHPQVLIERTRDPNVFTLIHGDAGPWNIFVPIEGDGPVYLIDRAPFEWSLTMWLGVYDLAYLLVTGLGVETRRNLEQPLLQRYHACLVENGVENYSWEQLYEDYRLMAAMGVYIATEWCRGGENPYKEIWMTMLHQALTAVDDLECSKLWQPG